MIEHRLKPTCLHLTVIIVTASILLGCQPTYVSPTSPSNISFTINVASGPLSANGGFLIVQGVAIARTSLGNFLAVSSKCTYDSANLNFQEMKNQFICPIDSSTFSRTGLVNLGPATKQLLLYRTILRSQKLTILGSI